MVYAKPNTGTMVKPQCVKHRGTTLVSFHCDCPHLSYIVKIVYILFVHDLASTINFVHDLARILVYVKSHSSSFEVSCWSYVLIALSAVALLHRTYTDVFPGNSCHKKKLKSKYVRVRNANIM